MNTKKGIFGDFSPDGGKGSTQFPILLCNYHSPKTPLTHLKITQKFQTWKKLKKIQNSQNGEGGGFRHLGKIPKKYVFFAFTPNHTEACLMFATFCFQHMSVHIQSPKKDPDYEGRTVTWAYLLLPQRSWRPHSWPLTHLKKLHSWCDQLLSEKYIFQKS